jgi:exosome complex component RRP46
LITGLGWEFFSIMMPSLRADFDPLYRADGSAQYSAAGYSIVGSINGPIEVQRRDELPEEAAIEVNIRPAAGVGGESLLMTS